MEETKKKYWFPAKKYGWGWGCPTCWQGWVVVAVYAVLAAVAGIMLVLHKHPVAFVVTLSVLSGIMIAICWATGEKPRWRWGDKKTIKN